MTGGGTAGRLHSKPLGFSTQPTVQPVKGMLVVGQLSAAPGARAVEERRRQADMTDNRRAHYSHRVAANAWRATRRNTEHIARGGRGATGAPGVQDVTANTSFGAGQASREYRTKRRTHRPGQGSCSRQEHPGYYVASCEGTRQDVVTSRRARARGAYLACCNHEAQEQNSPSSGAGARGLESGGLRTEVSGQRAEPCGSTGARE